MVVFPRNRYLGGATAKSYLPRDREKIAQTLGSATKVTIHCRVYDRSTNGVLNFQVSQGCFGTEQPSESPRIFTITPSSQTPTLPWDSTNMPNLPDDGTWYVQPSMMKLDVAALVSGGANTWVEFEIWATADFT